MRCAVRCALCVMRCALKCGVPCTLCLCLVLVLEVHARSAHTLGSFREPIDYQDQAIRLHVCAERRGSTSRYKVQYCGVSSVGGQERELVAGLFQSEPRSP